MGGGELLGLIRKKSDGKKRHEKEMFLFNYEVLLINYINYTPQVNTYYLFIALGPVWPIYYLEDIKKLVLQCNALSVVIPAS